ncbi:Uncharacterised protein [Mycobacteroides abscessus subsp. abscessus]|nr:Uncharacterised protein [Mycobacteroides abscessus subsp. abscessus]
MPASRGPDGENMAAVSISGYGWVYGRSCSWASRSVNQDVSRLIRSCGVARSSARIASSDSSCMRLWSTGSMPIMYASVGNAPGPVPKMTRPRVMWSNRIQRSTTING